MDSDLDRLGDMVRRMPETHHLLIVGYGRRLRKSREEHLAALTAAWKFYVLARSADEPGALAAWREAAARAYGCPPPEDLGSDEGIVWQLARIEMLLLAEGAPEERYVWRRGLAEERFLVD